MFLPGFWKNIAKREANIGGKESMESKREVEVSTRMESRIDARLSRKW